MGPFLFVLVVFLACLLAPMAILKFLIALVCVVGLIVAMLAIICGGNKGGS